MESYIKIESEDFPKTVCLLCNAISKNVTSNSLQHNYYDTKQSNLKQTIYNAIFSFLPGPHCSYYFKPRTHTDDALRDVAVQTLIFRSRRKYEEAERLEILMQNMGSSGGVGVKAALQLLCILADTNTHKRTPHLGYSTKHTPSLSHNRRAGITGPPSGPPEFGRTTIPDPDNLFYMQYPTEIFEVPAASFTCEESERNLICEKYPGRGLSMSHLFSLAGYLDDVHEQMTSMTLYGGLIESKVASDTLDIKLNMPALYPELDSGGAYHLKIPKAVEVTSDEDEGFDSVSNSITSLNSPPSDGHYDDDGDIFDRARRLSPMKHYNWESRGRKIHNKERAYLTECGPQAMDNVYALRQRAVAILCPQPPGRGTEVTLRGLVKTLTNLMIGVPSELFEFREAEQRFHMRDNFHLSGLTPESLASFAHNFLECGTNYCQVASFSHPVTVDSFYRDGLVALTFRCAVHHYLHHFQGAVLRVRDDITLSQLKLAVGNLHRQIGYLARLCKHGGSNPSPLPKGVQLIAYLYSETQQSQNTPHFLMMLSLLKTCCLPYCMFIHEWVFYGIHRDIYGEFLINFNIDAVHHRDKSYWTHAYTMSAVSDDTVPGFLRDLADDIFVCGKSLNLLKLCHDQHFLCNVDSRLVPRLFVTFSREDIEDIERVSEAYCSRMQQIARQISISREARVQQLEGERRDLVLRAKEVTEREMKLLQDEIDERKRQAKAKKQETLEELKSLMDSELKRKAGEHDASKREDKQYMDRLTKREIDWTDREIELELQAREELLAQYATLTEAAVRREQKALWRVRRHYNNVARREFLLADTKRWTNESVSVDDTDGHDKAGQADPPDWTKRDRRIVIDGKDRDGDVPGWVTLDETIVVRDEDKNVPGWTNTETTVVVDDEEGGELPGWTKRETAMVVNGEDGGELPEWVKRDEIGTKIVGEAVELLDFKESKDEVDKGLIGALSDEKEGLVDVGDVEVTVDLKESVSGECLSGVTVGSDDEKGDDMRVSEGRGEFFVVRGGEMITKETEESAQRAAIKMVGDAHVSKETALEGGLLNEGVKTVGKAHISVESSRENDSYRSGIKTFEHSVTVRSDQLANDVPLGVVKKVEGRHMTNETAPTEWKIKPPNRFGHVSQLFNVDERLTVIPRRKKHAAFHIGRQSRDFGIKSRRNKNRVAAESEADTTEKFSIRSHPVMSATKESDFVDVGAIRLQRFNHLNVYGHSSDSTIQRLLYADRIDEMDSGEVEEIGNERLSVEPQILLPEPYNDDFHILDEEPNLDTMSMGAPRRTSAVSGDTALHEYIPLASLMRRAIAAPLYAQVSLVNRALLDYFHTDLQLDAHFEALRRFLFMADGEFSQILSDSLFLQLFTSHHSSQLCNPMFLNAVLSKAVRASHLLHDTFVTRLSFAVSDVPPVFSSTSNAVLNCLELQYKVDWPVNIVVTDSHLGKYYAVFNFMLQLKRAVWVLKDIWLQLKRDGTIYKADTSSHFRQIQLFRQEMQHFVRVMQGYIVNQVIHVSWMEFSEVLTKHVDALDSLRAAHTDYLNKVLFRCLLNQKAAPILKIIHDIFSLVAIFRAQLISSPWQRDEQTGEIVHTKFAALQNSYVMFRQHSSFLYSVVHKLAQRGYQIHLHELLLRLNFNNYYRI